MADRIIQQLSIHLKGGQSIAVPFSAQQADVLNPQIEAFLKAVSDPEKSAGSFLFQGARVVLVRLSDVSACDVVSLVEKPKA